VAGADTQTNMSNTLLHSAVILLAIFAALTLGIGLGFVFRARAIDEASRAREKRIALALQGSNDGLWHWNMRTSVMHLSPRAYELLSYDPGDIELHIRAFRQLAHPEDLRSTRLALDKHLREQVPFISECRLRLKSGAYRWFRLRGQAERDNNGRPLQVAGSLTDITEQRFAEAAISRHALQQGLISELGQLALESPEIAELMSEALSVVTRGLNCEFCRLLVAGDDDRFLELKGGTGWDEEWMRRSRFDPIEETEDRFIIGVRDAIIIDDFERELRYLPSEMLRAHAVRSGAEVLVCGVRNSFGVLGIYSRSVQQFTLEDVGFLRGISNILASSMDRNLAQELVTAQEVKSRQSEERLRQIADSLPAMIGYWDKAGVCRFANEAHLRQIGIDSRDMVGKAFGEVFGAAYDVANQAHDAVLKGERQLFDMSAKVPDGTLRHWQGEFLPHRAEHEEVVGFYALIVDITERKNAEERLARQEALLAATGRMGEIGGWEIDLEDLAPRLSEMACRIHDLPPGSSLARETAAAFYTPESWAIVRRAISEAFELHKPFDYIVPFVTAKGRHRWIRSIGEPQLTNGRCSRVVCAIQDVTQQKNLEADLAQSQKLESIGQLAAGIAHEINTPTQFIGNNVGFMKEAASEIFGAVNQIKEAADHSAGSVSAADILKVLDSVDLPYLLEEVPRAIQQSIEGIERIQRIVGAMKEFSHPAMEKSPVDINRAIGTTITVASNEWKYVAEIKTDLDENLPAVPVMPGSFNQVILNMIVNAAHAVAEVVQGGSAKGTISISTRQVDNWAEIRIHDTGCGIPEKIRDRIFDPFFTTKPVGKGTGQGLAIAHDVIVKKHGGAIAVESAPGAGTTFILRLPFEAPASEEVAAA
jgi:PAS domain S-box-containing protein